MDISVNGEGTVKADSHIACRANAVPLPCRAAKGLECVFPIWFTQCGRVWFTLAMPRPCHALTMTFFSRPRHGQSMALSRHGSVNQTGPHRPNPMGKTHFKPLAARHGRGTAWARHATCESALKCTESVGLRRSGHDEWMQNPTMSKQAATATMERTRKREHQFHDGEDLKITVK